MIMHIKIFYILHDKGWSNINQTHSHNEIDLIKFL